jgi:hypothetical protein
MLGGFSLHGQFYYEVASWTPTHSKYDIFFCITVTDTPTLLSEYEDISPFVEIHFLLLSEVILSPAIFH